MENGSYNTENKQQCKQQTSMVLNHLKNKKRCADLFMLKVVHQPGKTETSAFDGLLILRQTTSP